MTQTTPIPYSREEVNNLELSPNPIYYYYYTFTNSRFINIIQK